MASYDIEALFTLVPVDLAISIIKNTLQQDPKLHNRTSMSIQHIITLLQFCLKNNYFQGQYFEPVHGAAMGSPLSPLVTNLFMEEFKAKAISTPPIQWGFGLGMGMTPLPSNRQNIATISSSTLIPLTIIFNSQQRLPRTMAPSPS